MPLLPRFVARPDLAGKSPSTGNCCRLGAEHALSCQHLHLFPRGNSSAPKQSICSVPINFFFLFWYTLHPALTNQSLQEHSDSKQIQFEACSAGSWSLLIFIPQATLPAGLPAAATYQSVTRSHHANAFSLQLHVLHLVRAFDQFPSYFHRASKSEVSKKARRTATNWGLVQSQPQSAETAVKLGRTLEIWHYCYNTSCNWWEVIKCSQTLFIFPPCNRFIKQQRKVGL